MWHARAKRVIAWLCDNAEQVARFLNDRTRESQERAARMPVIETVRVNRPVVKVPAPPGATGLEPMLSGGAK